MAYCVPASGRAPRWCAFLDGLTEELEEKGQSHFEDYRFVSRTELEELGGEAFVGTPQLERPFGFLWTRVCINGYVVLLPYARRLQEAEGREGWPRTGIAYSRAEVLDRNAELPRETHCAARGGQAGKRGKKSRSRACPFDGGESARRRPVRAMFTDEGSRPGSSIDEWKLWHPPVPSCRRLDSAKCHRGSALGWSSFVAGSRLRKFQPPASPRPDRSVVVSGVLSRPCLGGATARAVVQQGGAVPMPVALLLRHVPRAIIPSKACSKVLTSASTSNARRNSASVSSSWRDACAWTARSVSRSFRMAFPSHVGVSLRFPPWYFDSGGSTSPSGRRCLRANATKDSLYLSSTNHDLNLSCICERASVVFVLEAPAMP